MASRPLSDRIRTLLPPDLRSRVRRFGDRHLTALGSIKGVNGPTSRVALTFDDGPDPEVTPRLLDLLAARARTVTFFVLTERADAHPDLIRRMTREGHEVGLHFDRHDRLTDLPLNLARQRLAAARDRLAGLAGSVRFFRPPFGSQSLPTFLMARSLGLEVVVWGPAARDWVEQAPAQAAQTALDEMEPGDVVLLHDGMVMPDGEAPPTFDRVAMVERLLDGMAAAGLEASTVGALLAEGPARLSPWFRH